MTVYETEITNKEFAGFSIGSTSLIGMMNLLEKKVFNVDFSNSETCQECFRKNDPEEIYRPGYQLLYHFFKLDFSIVEEANSIYDFKWHRREGKRESVDFSVVKDFVHKHPNTVFTINYYEF